MRTNIILVFSILLGSHLSSSVSFAQEVTSSADKPKIERENISEEQLAILKANREKQIEFRNAFRSTLTGNQLDILTDPGLTREQRITSFRATLSDNQVAMVKSNRKHVRMQNFTLRTTLSDKQRLRIRRMAVNRAQQNRALYLRARLRNRLGRI